MFSSRPSGRLPAKPRRPRQVPFSSLACPVCGRRALADVVEDCELSGGRRVKRLRHVRCRSCGERFFDVAAMTRIEMTVGLSRRRQIA